MSRCLETARITFEGQKLHKDKPFEPIVKEFLREGISGHTCDRRRTKTYIHENWPKFEFEKGFTEYVDTALISCVLNHETSVARSCTSEVF